MNYLIVVLILMVILLIWHCKRLDRLEETMVDLDDFLSEICDTLNDLQNKEQ